MALPTVDLAVNGDIIAFMDGVFNYATISMLLGALGFVLVFNSLFTTKVDMVVEDVLNHISVWRSICISLIYLKDRERKNLDHG